MQIVVSSDDRHATNSSNRKASNVEAALPLASNQVNSSADDKNDVPYLQAIDANIVWWDGDDDAANARNWKLSRKWTHVAVVALMNFVTPLASSMFAPGVRQAQKEFNNYNNELSSFVVSVYVLGFAFGPLVLSPLSEIYGRLYIYHGSNIAFVCFTIGCAFAPSFNSLIVLRFLAGCAGATGQTVGGGTIGDLFVQIERGLPMSLYTLGPVIGPAIGPVGGGFLSQAKGWRWVFYLLAMLGGVTTIVTFLFMQETYAPVLLEQKAEKLKKETGNMALRSKLHQDISRSEFLKLSFVRPLKLLVMSPIVTILACFMAITYGQLYLLFTTFSSVFERVYGFTQGTVGLAYIGIGFGCLIGTVITGYTTDPIMARLSKNGGERKPEYRLPMMIPGAFVLPIGLIWYGWSAHSGVQFMMPIIGSSLFGMGLMMIFLAISMYLVDYSTYAASALAGAAVMRSLAGALLPLAGESLYTALGLGWGNTLLAFIALIFAPVPILLFKYGDRIRRSTKINL